MRYIVLLLCSLLSGCTLIALSLLAKPAEASTVVNGLYVGMSQAEAEKLPPQTELAGVPSSYPPVVHFHRGRLAVFIFYFDRDSFDVVRSVFAKEYPHLACEDSVVTQDVSTINQTTCRFRDAGTVFMLKRYLGTIGSSFLSIYKDPVSGIQTVSP